MLHLLKRLQVHHWTLVALGVGFCICFSVLGWMTYRDMMIRRGPFWDKYQRVQKGMTEAEVRDILGPEAEFEHIGGSTSSTDYLYLSEDEKSISVDLSEGEVIKKTFRPRAWWEHE